MESPNISVIICAFNRRNYINYAINSVLNQTIDPSKYELIVVSNFEVTVRLDKKYNYTTIVKKTQQKRLNLMVYGIKKAKGDILCFLDDDDLFSNDKLERILELFSKNDKLGYIHNSFSLIDREGNDITSHKLIKLWKQPNKDYYITYKKIKRHLRKITNYCGIVNLSSISIRSSIIDKHSLDYLENLPGNTDEFIFDELLHSRFDLFMTKDILSLYRIHRENNSKPKTPAEIIEYVERLRQSLEMLNRLLEHTEFFEYGQMKLKYWIYKEQLIDENLHISFKFVIIMFENALRYRTDYYLSLVFFSLYKFIFKKSPIILMKKY